VTYRSAILTASVVLVSSGVHAATPTRSEAVDAIRDFCPGLRQPISRVRCEGFGEDEPTEAVCSYHVGGKKPRNDKTYLAVDRNGWGLIDQPAYCPGMKQGKN
jgi:hypothetical protein